MDIWITWNKRRATCRFCQKPITVASPMIRGKLWRKSGTATKWSYQYYWHPQCYMEEQMAYLAAHPYQSTHHGRPRLEMDEDTRAKRIKVLRKRATLVYKLKEQLENGKNVDWIIDKLMEAMIEIEQLGGAPKSWSKLPL